MASISVSDATKREFDELLGERTHDEFVQALLRAYKRDQGQVVDPEQIAEAITKTVASEIELAAYRGVADALELDGERDL